MSRWAWRAAALLVLVTSTTGSAAARPDDTEAAFAAELVELINGERSARGLPPLTVDPVLQDRAQAHAEALRASGGIRPSGVSEPGVAEAVARPGADRPSGFAVVGWMSHRGHRQVLVHEHGTEIGVGVACSGEGAYLVVLRRAVAPGAATGDDPMVTDPTAGGSCVDPSPSLGTEPGAGGGSHGAGSSTDSGPGDGQATGAPGTAQVDSPERPGAAGSTVAPQAGPPAFGAPDASTSGETGQRPDARSSPDAVRRPGNGATTGPAAAVAALAIVLTTAATVGVRSAGTTSRRRPGGAPGPGGA